MKIEINYDWYKLDTSTRHDLWLKNEIITIIDGDMPLDYLPILWENEWCNYGQRYGLVYFPKIYGGHYDNPKYIKAGGRKWFGVRVFSPDDWDYDLDIYLDNSATNDFADEQRNYLIRITKDYISTGPVCSDDILDLIKNTFLEKYPTATIHLN